MKAAIAVRWHGVGIGVAAILMLWTRSANDWPMWAIPAIWMPVALLLLASMTAFTVAALRGRPGRRRRVPVHPAGTPATAPTAVRPGGAATEAGGGLS
ncbi:hypothetical protein [Streptomyces formicae]|uniref:Integral membrane protein n=1 Tax=Streptomyces formicae TaxID=1616117 RepID=A0ABY3WVH6_9ACTN|nr:hypothetical protein [Streptomyces formicae]UNM16105.1 hypothetical protein J4032_35750 [Streptomyces formicae]